MADADDVRRIALALPDVVEIESAGFELLCLATGFRRSHTKYASSSDDSDGSTTQHHVQR